MQTVEKFNKIDRGQDTSFLFGGPIHKVHERKEIRQKITEPVPLTDELAKTKDKLQNAWRKTKYHLNPMMHDRRVSDSTITLGSPPPESRNFGFRVGKKLVADELTSDIQKAHLSNAKKTSFFVRNGTNCRGTKNGAVRIQRSPGGGFMASPKDNQAMQLERTLKAFPSITAFMDNYTNDAKRR